MIVIILGRDMDAFDKLIAHLSGPPRMAQHVFARRIKAQQSEISLWVRRLRRPPIKYWTRLNRVLGTTHGEWIEARLVRASERAA